MAPKRCLSPVQLDSAYPDGQISALSVADWMDRFQGTSQLGCVDLQLRPTALESSLRLGNAVLDGFHPVAAGERPPRSYAVGFQDDVRIDQYDPLVSSHGASQSDCASDIVRFKEIHEFFDAQIKQTGNASHRDAALLDRNPEHLHKGS